MCFKKNWKWFLGLKKLNRLVVVASLCGILALLIGIPLFIDWAFFPENCTEEDYDVCKQILENLQSDKIENLYTDPFLYNNLLEEKYGLSEKQIQNLANNFKEYARTEYDIGIAFAGLNDYNNAIIHFNNAIDLDDTNPDYYYSKAVSLFFIGELEPALETIDQSLDIYGENENALVVKARILEELGNLNDSLEVYDYALSLDPNDSGLWNDRGIILGKQQKYEEAIESFDKSLEIDNPDDVITLDNKGIALMWLQKYDNVVNTYTKIIERVPEYQKAYDNRGYAYYKLEDFNLALNDWNISLKMDGDNPFVCRVSNIGDALVGLDRLNGAQYYFEWAESIDSNFFEMCYNVQPER